MHKLAKGLKKKKKGKKSKHKEEELFKPEELEAYRREHAAANEESSAKNEEWKNFLSLTSGVDDILKKTQDDLDRIKSTSFFQRIPPPSETKAKQEPAPSQSVYHAPPEEAPSAQKEEDPTFGIVQVSDSESEEEEDDDIFDTAYIDAIATGEVKLAYIPESPTEKPDGDDPFDTSIAERAILGPVVERKGKKLVPLGAAVEVLIGRVQLPTCATTRPVSKRQILKQRDLLGSFDNGTEPPGKATSTVADSPGPIKTLLDDDEIPLPDEPIDLSKSIYIPPPQAIGNQSNQYQPSQQDILKEFDDEDDKEFEALAAESLSKSATSAATVLTNTVLPVGVVENAGDWKPFEQEKSVETEDFEKDPFDTTFAENILPGKAELKLLEREILENDVDFDPRAPEVNNSDVYNDRIPASELNLIAPVHRDLLGGSTSDLSQLGDKPIQPTEESRLEDIKYCDPFDTSIVDTVKAPGQAELKLLENELLGDIKPTVPVALAKVLKSVSIDDDNFNPRALEGQRSKTRALSRPDVLNVGQAKTVSFTVPQKDLLGADDTSKIIKPLTPFYVRKNSVPGTDNIDDQSSDEVDPFDTSFVPNIAPGKAELKQIESELFCSNVERNINLDDPDFDPRDNSKIAKFSAVEAIKEIAKPQPTVLSTRKEPIDLLAASNDISVKVLTPAENIHSSVSEDTLLYADPFDTTIATNIPPGKAELRLLESELIKPNLAESTFSDHNKDLLVHNGDTIIEKPLTPELGNNFDIEPDDFDPFDTSFASNIQPGRAELKVLESELM